MNGILEVEGSIPFGSTAGLSVDGSAISLAVVFFLFIPGKRCTADFFLLDLDEMRRTLIIDQ